MPTEINLTLHPILLSKFLHSRKRQHWNRLRPWQPDRPRRVRKVQTEGTHQDIRVCPAFRTRHSQNILSLPEQSGAGATLWGPLEKYPKKNYVKASLLQFSRNFKIDFLKATEAAAAHPSDGPVKVNLNRVLRSFYSRDFGGLCGTQVLCQFWYHRVLRRRKSAEAAGSERGWAEGWHGHCCLHWTPYSGSWADWTQTATLGLNSRHQRRYGGWPPPWNTTHTERHWCQECLQVKPLLLYSKFWL